MTRVADTGNEDFLLNIALCGTATHSLGDTLTPAP